MILPDVNVLIYAFRADSKDHTRYKDWLEDAVNGPSAYGMSPQVLASVVRICSHPKIFAEPSDIDELLIGAIIHLFSTSLNFIVPVGDIANGRPRRSTQRRIARQPPDQRMRIQQ